MKDIKDFNSKIEYVLTDIDDTLTTEGQLPSTSYQALWNLKRAGIKIIPITGRPAGWCEMIARFWPVEGVVGENGGFYFRYANQKMNRWFFADKEIIASNQIKLKAIEHEILNSVPGAAVSSDQFCRLLDLAIDFCEDVPRLSQSDIEKIVQIFRSHGAIAKISSIHVNGWFGNYDKVSTSLLFLKNEFGLDEKNAKEKCIFVGDSPNDEPMFEKFPHSFGVANVRDFITQLKTPPRYISKSTGGEGFFEISEQLLKFI